jgi:hypothetical protein
LSFEGAASQKALMPYSLRPLVSFQIIDNLALIRCAACEEFFLIIRCHYFIFVPRGKRKRILVL